MGVIVADRVHGYGNSNKVTIYIEGERVCGSGRFSNVYSAYLTSPEKRAIAIKNAWVPEDKETSDGSYPEIIVLSRLKHNHIISLLYHFVRKIDKQIIHCMVFDFMPDDLYKLRMKGTKFDLLDAKLYSYQLFAALSYLAIKNIVHLDIKPANLVLNHQEGVLKLADFGNAADLSTTVTLPPYQVTRYYRPPELLFGSKKMTTAIDTWSAACVMSELITHRVLFKGDTTKHQSQLIVEILGYPTESDIKSMHCSRPRVGRKDARGFDKFLGREVDAQALELIKGTLIHDPTKRTSPHDILKSRFFDALKKRPLPKRKNGQAIPDVIGGLSSTLQAVLAVAGMESRQVTSEDNNSGPKEFPTDESRSKSGESEDEEN